MPEEITDAIPSESTITGTRRGPNPQTLASELPQVHGYYRNYDIPTATEIADALWRRQAVEEARAEQETEARLVGTRLASH